MFILLGTKEHFFSCPIILPQILMCILWNVHLVLKILQEKWIRGKRENEMMVSLDLKTKSCYAILLWIELCPSFTPNVMVLGSRAPGRYPGWHGVLMVVRHGGISLSLFFSLILPLLPPLQPPHVRTYQQEKDWCKSRMSLLGTQLATTLMLHSLRSMTTCGTKRLAL